MSFKTLILFCGLAALPAISLTLQAENKIPEEAKTGGFFIGCQAYTFNHNSLFEAIQKTAESGGRVAAGDSAVPGRGRVSSRVRTSNSLLITQLHLRQTGPDGKSIH